MMRRVLFVQVSICFLALVSAANAQTPSSSAMEGAAASNLRQMEQMVQQLPSMRDAICARQSNPAGCRADALFANLQRTYESIVSANREQISALRQGNNQLFGNASQRVTELLGNSQSLIEQIRRKYPQ